MPATIVVADLAKRYGAVEAVRGVSFAVAEGEIVGLLGPNGAGKTTTLECVIGLREPDAGRIEVCGIDARRRPQEVRERIGVQLQATALPDRITVREALVLFASFYRNAAQIDGLLDRFALADKARARFETLSGGQKQRLAMALALVNRPELLLLDEPTANLDPQARRELHGVIREMKAAGRSVLLTTHYIEEAELLCDRVAIVDHGQIIAEGTPAALIAGTRTPTRIALTTARPLDRAAVSALSAVSAVEITDNLALVSTAKVTDAVIELVKLLDATRCELLDLHIRKPSLEDVFIELTGRKLRD